MSKFSVGVPIVALLMLGISVTGCSSMIDRHHGHHPMSQAPTEKCCDHQHMAKEKCDAQKIKDSHSGDDQKMKTGQCCDAH